MPDPFWTAFHQVTGWSTLGVVVVSAVYGLVMGAIPGLTATMAVALLIPLTFFLTDLHAVAAIVTLAACAIFAGDIPTMLVRIPGTPASAAYVDDAYAFTQAGEHERPLAVSLVFSVVGGLVGAVLLMTSAPWLATIALSFTTYEYFWLMLLGLSAAAVVSRGSVLKGTLALLIGLLLSTVGLSQVQSAPRFTFGRDDLIGGVTFIPAMIGLFGVSEVLRNVLGFPDGRAQNHDRSTRASSTALAKPSTMSPYRDALGLLWQRKRHVARSSSVGAVVGLLPGAGADIAAWVAFALSKRFPGKRHGAWPDTLAGIGDATTANNAALAGAWVPALVFGIPGDSITAIVIGVLLMKNVTPGPAIFTDPATSTLVYGIYLIFVLANLALIPLGFLAIRAGVRLVRIHKTILMPAILLFCIVGSYAINGSYFDVWIMMGMGLLGFVLEGYAVPLSPIVLGIILGGSLEETFIQNLTKSESLIDFVSRPVAALLATVCALVWLLPLATVARRRAPRP